MGIGSVWAERVFQMSYRILCVDDDAEFLLTLKIHLKKFYRVFTANNLETALQSMREQNVDLVLLDIKLGRDDGLEGLKQFKKSFPHTDVVMVSGHRDPKLIVNAIRDGASDYICKPFANDELLAVIEKMIKLSELRGKQDALMADIKARDLARPLIGESKTFQDVLKRAQCVRGHEANVLIEGESGTGKELLARYIHELESNPERPFIAVNCAAIPETLIESELFGHEKGAFSGAFQRRVGKFELAHGGDIFLDEINSLKPELQAKILRVLQEKEIYRVGGNQPIRINFRVIAATNSNLDGMVTQGTFRMDLFHRLRVVSLRIPSLRERVDDIVVLIGHFLKKFSRGQKRMTEAAMARLMDYSWPGNVRELENMMHSLVIMTPSAMITEKELPEWITKQAVSEQDLMNHEPHELSSELPDEIQPLKKYLASIEQRYIKRVLVHKNGDKTRTAMELGISRTSLYEKMRGEKGFIH